MTSRRSSKRPASTSSCKNFLYFISSPPSFVFAALRHAEACPPHATRRRRLLRGMRRRTRYPRSPPPGQRPMAEGLQLDVVCGPPAPSLPLLDVRLDVAGPAAGAAIDVQANKFDLDVGVQTFPIGNAEMPASARRAEADGTGCRHLNPSFG